MINNRKKSHKRIRIGRGTQHQINDKPKREGGKRRGREKEWAVGREGERGDRREGGREGSEAETGSAAT